MTCCTIDRAEQLLCDLIALRTVNPMGRPQTGNLPVERPVVEYLELLFAPYGIQHRRLPCNNPTIVLGPGSIGQAHAVDQYVELAQIVNGVAIYHNILSRDWLR